MKFKRENTNRLQGKNKQNERRKVVKEKIKQENSKTEKDEKKVGVKTK